ncbi:MAG: tetratricopeptide repeat protein [Cyanobacteria bacterium Co-bin8]|nr:tetratricopeptide repeat protein [Cyanobacteria bacterium Co-bin8]
MPGASISVPHNLPHQGTAHFIGRGQALQRLRHELQHGGRVTIAPADHSSGIGKTELALQYAQTYWSEYPGGICWINAQVGRIDEQVLEFVKYQLELEPPSTLAGSVLTLPQQLDWCWQHWRPDERVLIVIDEATDLATCRRVLLPQANQFHIIVTSLEPDLVPRSSTLILEGLSPTTSLQLLYPDKVATSLEDTAATKAAAALCQWSAQLPLTLKLLAAYLAQPPKPSPAQVQAQLDLIERHQAQNVGYSVHFREMAGSRLRAVLELIWAVLEPETQSAACLLSLFAPEAIPLDPAEWTLQGITGENYCIRPSLEQLQSFALLEPAQAPVPALSLHPLIRTFFREKLALGAESIIPQQILEQALAATLAGIARAIPQELTPEMTVALSPISGHLAEVVQHHPNRLSDENLIWPFIGLGRFYQSQGLFSLAEPWWQACLVATQQRFGETHPDVAFSLNNLALIYRHRGYVEKAEAFYQQFIEKISQLFKEEHPTRATGLNNLAALYRSLGRLEEAEMLYQKALVEEHPPENDHLSVVTSLNNLADLYRCQGRCSEAEPLYQKALAMAQRLLGSEHAVVATCLNNLAQLYCAQKRYKEAEALHTQVLNMRRRLFGKEHVAIATSLNNLAELYRIQERYRKAESLYTQSLEMIRRISGEEHPNFASGLNNLGVLYARLRRFDQAINLLQQALTKQLQLLGESHPDTQRTLHNLDNVRAAKPQKKWVR